MNCVSGRMIVLALMPAPVQRPPPLVVYEAVFNAAQVSVLLDLWIAQEWMHRPHDGLRHPALPKRTLTPGEMYSVLSGVTPSVPMPLARERLAERGFNQALLLAQHLAPRRTDARLLLRLILTGKGGCAVLEAASGAEALGQIGSQRPDAVILDYMMPDMDGLEVCRRIRAMPGLEAVPILMLTARPDPPLREKALAAGVDTVAFDRSGFLYHGRIKSLADAAREAAVEGTRIEVTRPGNRPALVRTEASAALAAEYGACQREAGHRLRSSWSCANTTGDWR